MSQPITRWKAIRHEWETTKISFQDLADKYDINIHTLKTRRKREAWDRSHPAPYDPLAEDGEIILKEKKARAESMKLRDQAVAELQKIQKNAPKLLKDKDKPISIEYTREDSTTVEIDLLEYLNDEEDGLTEGQRLFCYHYVGSFNVTRAYQKAFGCTYNTARQNGYLLMQKPAVTDKIRQLKFNNAVALHLEARDILEQYMNIAFADITDYIEFGKQVKTIKHAPKDDEEEGLTEEYLVNYVDLKDSSQVNGSIVTEIRQGRDGISIKLADKMKALDFLSKYMDVLKLREKHELEKEQLKTNITKTKNDIGAGEGDTEQTIIVTGEDEMRRVLAEQKKANESATEEAEGV